MQRRLFIDPASKSTGWAYFEGPELILSGTVMAPKALDVMKRLHIIRKAYEGIAEVIPLDEVHIEQLVRNTNILCHYSVGVIGSCFFNGTRVGADIPISSWQKEMDWHGERAPLKKYKKKVVSEDELAAIGMGLWYTKFKGEGDVRE